MTVVKGPAVLVGNSIGGFISASAAADYPGLVSGLVLVNSAGPIDAAFDIAAHAGKTKKPPPAWLARALTAGEQGGASIKSTNRNRSKQSNQTNHSLSINPMQSKGLMLYLERSIAGQLKWLYPTAPERADAWLEAEIFR